MDLSEAISEPLVNFIEFHNELNNGIKFTIGALEEISNLGAQNRQQPPNLLALPSGGEPWRDITQWRNVVAQVGKAKQSISELWIARAASAFEDFVTQVIAELSRVSARGIIDVQASTNLEPTASRRIAAQLRINGPDIEAIESLVQFFQLARNCILHRSGRASSSMAVAANSGAVTGSLAAWPKRSVKKWQPSLPEIKEGEIVEWLPRHVILASDVYYRFAVEANRGLIALLGARGVVEMAAHWCFLSERPVKIQARRDTQTMLQSILKSRYRVKSLGAAEANEILRDLELWADCQASFRRRFT